MEEKLAGVAKPQKPKTYFESIEEIKNEIINFNLVDQIFGTDNEANQIKKLAAMSYQELVEMHGYSFEKYSVQTDDGYILELHRIFKEKKEGQPVVFLQHGLFSCSETFIMTGKDSSAFRFAELGYDVWLGNNRGNQYSRNHVRLNPQNKEDQKEYFDYSFYELAKYDLPANIDFVLNQTKQQKISYMGHSQGTT